MDWWIDQPPMGSLHNAVRAPNRTCRVCAAPVNNFRLCWRCREHRRIPGIADIVAPLIYAVPETESAALLRNYKNCPLRAERDRCAQVIRALLWRAVSAHERCFGVVAGIGVSRRAVIPSLTSRPGIHPLASIAGQLGLVGEPLLVAAPNARCDRAVVADKFTPPAPAEVSGRHVLVIDDVWTTGSNAQSAALTLRRAGAAFVSVLVLGRWVDPRNTVSAQLIRDHCQSGYDRAVCPVTGGRCP